VALSSGFGIRRTASVSAGRLRRPGLRVYLIPVALIPGPALFPDSCFLFPPGLRESCARPGLRGRCPRDSGFDEPPRHPQAGCEDPACVSTWFLSPWFLAQPCFLIPDSCFLFPPVYANRARDPAYVGVVLGIRDSTNRRGIHPQAGCEDPACVSPW